VRVVGEYAGLAVLAIVLSSLLKAFVGLAFYIPSGSMEPTLQINDRPTAALERQDFHDAFIKRVIGLPGDTVAVRGGRVFVDGKPLTEPYIADTPRYQYGPVKVPAGQYLVLGDNRNASLDSHLWGPLPRSAVIGTAVLRYWPLNRLGPIRFPDQRRADALAQLG